MEDKRGKKAVIKSLPMPNTDVYKTYADISELGKLTGYYPTTKIEDGLELFLDWFKEYN